LPMRRTLAERITFRRSHFTLIPNNSDYIFNSDDLLPDDSVANDRKALEPVLQSLREAGYYAYGMLNEHNIWTIAADDEIGRIDVRVGQDGFEVVMGMSSPGLYADEESPWKQSSRARLARIALPRIARGFLEPHQTATWDEADQGVAVTEHYELPFTRAADIGHFVRDNHPRLENLLTLIERQLD
jgi:hypothetical protein